MYPRLIPRNASSRSPVRKMRTLPSILGWVRRSCISALTSSKAACPASNRSSPLRFRSERILAQPSQENAHLALHLGLGEAVLYLSLDLLEGRLPGFKSLVHLEDQEGIRPPDGIADEALLLGEHQVFDRLVQQAFGHGPDLAAVLGGLHVI